MLPNSQSIPHDAPKSLSQILEFLLKMCTVNIDGIQGQKWVQNQTNDQFDKDTIETLDSSLVARLPIV